MRGADLDEDHEAKAHGCGVDNRDAPRDHAAFLHRLDAPPNRVARQANAVAKLGQWLITAFLQTGEDSGVYWVESIHFVNLAGTLPQ
ncbi:MAG: hypothetical protein Gyms2KO_08380 [Gymnodinialimonas sp.]